MEREILELFCDKDSDKLGEPFLQDGYVWATNGIMIIRIENNGEYKEKDAPKTNELNLLPDKKGKWVPVKDIELSEKVKCPSCEGKGMINFCEECDGEGLVYWWNDFNYETECKSCHGYGYFPGSGKKCHRCKGKGKIFRQYESVTIEKTRISQELLDLTLNLDNPEIFIPHNKTGLIPLRFNGGIGGILRMLNE